MPNEPFVIVIGAGIGGLATAIALATRGVRVTVLEKAAAPGGKMREVEVAGTRIDAGPTVLTMKWVLDEIFSNAGSRLEDHVHLSAAEILARHAWGPEERLDLFADVERTVAGIGELAGPAEARRYRTFCRQAQRTYEVLERPFIRASLPSLPGLIGRIARNGLGGLAEIKPYATMWKELGRHFHDPRLRQMFGRYATYCGSSPFQAPATLMLIAHVERSGVWLVEGGMHRLALALMALGRGKGVVFRFDATVDEVLADGGRVNGVRLRCGERIASDAVVVNADVAAITKGMLGPGAKRAVPRTAMQRRSLSAVTWAALAHTRGFPLVRHNVFFGPDSANEFREIFDERRLPSAPTVYVCAQDRDGSAGMGAGGPERLLVVVNAPPTGDCRPFETSEIEQCEQRVFSCLQHNGLELDTAAGGRILTTPTDFDRLFPGSGGALYGQASHGWLASFQRSSARSRVPGLYLAGGSVHPGAGVPMAALSGQIAAAAVLEDCVSTSTSRRVVTSGGTSML